MLQNKNVLVTGGTGMIGRELVKLLLEKGSKVRVVSLDEPVDFFEEVEFIKRDLTDYNNCLEACKDMDYVFNVIGIKCTPVLSATKPLSYFIPMVRYNMNMMEAAFHSNVKWFLYTSSYGVYSHSKISHEDDVWKTFPSENDKLPGWAKRIGELQAEGYKIQYDWDNISIVRPTNVYGPWDNFDLKTAMVIPSLIRKASENEVLSVWGNGTPIRDFIHARDVARGMIFAVENKITEPLNLGSGDGVQIKDLAFIIANCFNVGLSFDSSKPSGDHKRVIDMSRAYSYGFKNTINIEDGIKETIEWYLNNKDKLNYRYDPYSEK